MHIEEWREKDYGRCYEMSLQERLDEARFVRCVVRSSMIGTIRNAIRGS